ncbi:MAG TPA: hypothetical protein VFG84_03750, partial [Gemmatimonadaceae bacterium]|nr:hypothetical protein [Gemmatimonadaceae bacterium]
YLHGRAGFWPDFVFPWTAAGQLRSGIDPYQALPGGLIEPFETPLLYPLTTVLATLPVSWMRLAAAGGVAMGFSAALLAWVLTARGFDRLWVLVSAPFVMAINLGQWSPLVMTAALVPAAGCLATLKPNIGLAVFIWRPSWRFAVSAALFGALSIAVLPRWPLEWLAAVRSLPGHPAPLLAAGGAGLLLLLAVIRWRTPAARLLLAMAFVPQLLLFADQLPLWLIARNRREVQLLSTLSMIGFMGWIAFLPPGRPEALRAQPWVMAFVYLPALLLVLWRRKGAGAATDQGWLVPDDQGSATRKATRAESPPAIVTTTESG